MSGRVFLVLLVLGSVYAWQNQHELRRWWQQYNGEAAATGIRVYTARGCGPCQQAIDLLQGAGHPVAVRNVDEDESARAEFERAGRGAMPLILDGHREMRGFNAQLLSDWYVERAQTARFLDQLGVYGAGEPRVPVLYGTDWCPYCAKARQYFAANGIIYRDLDIERDGEARRQHEALGYKGVPVIVYADMVWSGFSAESMNERRKWVGDVR